MAVVNLFDANVNTGPASKSINQLEEELASLQARFKGAEIGSEEWQKLGEQIQKTSSQLKTFEERFEGLGIEQRNAAIVDSFNVVAGSIGAVTGAMVALGFESKLLEDVEKRLFGIIVVVSSLREVSNGLAGLNKVLPGLTANIVKVATALKGLILANPILATVAALGAVATAIALINKNQEGTVDLLKQEQERRERILALLKSGQEFSDKLFDNARRLALLQEDEIGAQKEIIEAAKQARNNQQATSRQIIKGYEDEAKELNRQIGIFNQILNAEKNTEQFAKQAREGKQKAAEKLLDIQSKINLEEQKVAAARLLILEEEDRLEQIIEEKRKKRREDAKKAAEDLANRAVKQLEAQRQATDDLIALYAELFPGPRSSGAYNLGNDLDRANFFLAEQIDILFRLKQAFGSFGDELRDTQDEYEELIASGEKFLNKDQLDILKRLREGSKTQLDEQLDALKSTYEADLALFSDNEDVKSQLTEEYERNRAQLRRQYAIQTGQQLLGITSQFLNTIASINQANLELQLAQAQGNQAAITRINEKALEEQKKLRIAQTLVTTAESVLNGFNVTSTLPPPFNLIAGGVLAAAYTALGAKTIQQIQSTKLGSTGTSGQGGQSGLSFDLGGASAPAPAVLPGLPGGGRLGAAPAVGTLGEAPLPIQAYVLANDVTNGQQAAAAISNRRRLNAR